MSFKAIIFNVAFLRGSCAGKDLTADKALFGHVFPQESGHVLFCDFFKHLREAESVIAVEIPFRHGDGHILKRVQAPDIVPVGGPAQTLVKRLVNLSRAQTPGLLENLRDNRAGIPALSARVQTREPRQQFKVPAESIVDQPLFVQAQIERAGIPKQQVAGQVPNNRLAEPVLSLTGGRAP